MSDHPFIAAIREQLARNARERAFLESALAEARRFYQNGDAQTVLPLPAITPTASPPRPNRGAFGPQPGGPKETILAVAAEQPGLSRDELRRLVTARVQTKAKDPKRSVDETLRVLLRSGDLVEREGGFHISK